MCDDVHPSPGEYAEADLLRAVDVEHIQHLCFVVPDLEGVEPIRTCIFGDGIEAVRLIMGLNRSPQR